MLVHLIIKNYALIAHASLSFTDGLTVITGETGAGKSILLDALGLVLGKRADLSALRNTGEKCVIEAHFDLQHYSLQSFFETNELDYDSQTILRREILPSGKSRVFVNDSPVTLQVLTLLGEQLIDIHSQHQTQELFQESYHLQVIDALAKNNLVLETYRKKLLTYKGIQHQIQVLKEEQQALSKEQDYISFLLHELVEAQLKPGEQEEMEADLQRLSNVEFVEEALQKSHSVLTDEQFGILQMLKEVKASLQKIGHIAPEYEELYERIQSSEIELKDITDELHLLSGKLEQDPQQLELLSSKLQLIYQLQKKHQVQTVNELIEVRETLTKKVFKAGGIDERLIELEKEEELLVKELQKLGEELHKKREKAIPGLMSQLKDTISPIGMPNAQFDYKLQKTSHFYHNGTDTLQVLFSANKGMPFAPMKKAASGGEMSRIMLTIKAILSQYTQLPTLILDEIDTGVSGDVADKMGTIMKQMSTYMQVFAITHLPQVAAKGKIHFKVMKDQSATVTQSKIAALSESDRVSELAQMLSGNKVTEAAVLHAKTLLGYV